MADVMKMVYETVEQMIKTFEQGGEQLQDTMTEMQSIAGVIEGGALLGEGGKAFEEAIRNQLARSLNKLTEKFGELAQDCKSAMDEMKQADSESAGMF